MATKPESGLERKDYLAVSVLAALFALSAAILIAQHFRADDRMEAGLRREKLLAARFAAGRISDFMEHERVDLMNAAGMLSSTGDVEKGSAALEHFLKPGKRRMKFFSFFVMDPKGRFLYSVPESLVDRYMQDLSGRNYFREVAKTGEFFDSGAQRDGMGGWEVVLSAPVVSGGGRNRARLLGVLAEKIDMKVLEGMSISGIEVGRDGCAFLMDENGRLIANKKGSRSYQIESSSEALMRMTRGEEGSLLQESPESGKPELTVFSPATVGGSTWSVGIVVPSSGLPGEDLVNLVPALLAISLMALALSWSLVSVVRARRYGASMRERAGMSGDLMLRNRELTALNDLSRAMGVSEDLDGLIKKALEIIMAGTGAAGGAVRIVSPPSGELVPKACSGAPAPFAGNAACDDYLQSRSKRALSKGIPEYLSEEALSAAGPACQYDQRARALALVPLLVKKKPLGILQLWGLEEENYSGKRKEFLSAVGSQLAAGVENVLQMEDTNRHSARASALFHTAQALTRSLDLDALLNIIMQETVSLLKVKRCMLLLYSEEANRIDCRVALGFDSSPAGVLSFSPSGLFWDAMEDGGVKVVDLGEAGHDLPRRFVENVGLERFILLPLVSKGKVLGFIVLEMPRKADELFEDLKLIAGFANQAAVAIETSSFYIRTMEKYNEDLQQLSNRIIEAQEEERKRISRDLHDELGQSLTAIKINLDMAMDSLAPSSDSAHVRSRLRDAVELVLSTLDNVRRLSFELRPSMLDDLGLSTVLGKLVSDFRKRSGIDVEFSEEGPPERLDPQTEVVLYRAVQEGLTNIAKHAGATKVVVNLKKDPGKKAIGLYIEDNGVGFSLQPDGLGRDTKGFGLMGIRERVSLLGGNFRIFTEKDRGTRLLIDIPWKKGEDTAWKEM